MVSVRRGVVGREVVLELGPEREHFGDAVMELGVHRDGGRGFFLQQPERVLEATSMADCGHLRVHHVGDPGIGTRLLDRPDEIAAPQQIAHQGRQLADLDHPLAGGLEAGALLMRIEQDGKSWTAKKNYVWTCNKGTKEQAFNDSKAVAIMRITDLKG